ncbi:hypothetical protein ACO0K3_03740 [Undibacterium sp. Rencai35W]|uniref:hypothetical protein n=1 Tax=Undibacterium sp. Rencai35W TaxID=3413046 RepID=UPI003BEFEC40
MNAILFTMDFEPITVIDLPMWAHEFAWKHQHLALAVIEPPKCFGDGREICHGPKYVRIRVEKLVWLDKSQKIVYVTDDEESALLLKSSFLAGQEKDVQEREKSAFCKGILAAIERMR